MAKHVLMQYRGRLTPRQAADGINAARRNAERLHADAALLFEQRRYESACTLAILSIEESGKPAILRRIATASSDEALKKIWREYRTHTAKNIAWILVDLAKNGATRLDDLKLMVDPTSDHPQVLDQLKQLSVYTDCLVSATWSSPSSTVDEKMARGLVQSAKILLGRKAVCTAREIELWIEHVGSADDGSSKAKALNYFRAMIGEGLENTPIEQVCDFLGLESPGPAGDEERQQC